MADHDDEVLPLAFALLEPPRLTSSVPMPAPLPPGSNRHRRQAHRAAGREPAFEHDRRETDMADDRAFLLRDQRDKGRRAIAKHIDEIGFIGSSKAFTLRWSIDDLFRGDFGANRHAGFQPSNR